MSLAAWWQQILAVALGGALGSAGRFVLSGWLARLVGQGFPWGTLAVNLIGSLLAGAALAWFHGHEGGPAALRLFVMAGLLGGFTTWSAMAVDTLLLGRSGAPAWAALYVAATLAGGLLLVWLGWRGIFWMRG